MDNLLTKFGSLEALQEFLEEQINDGSEISRGKDENDKSKEEKSVAAEEGEPNELEGDPGEPQGEGGAFEPGPGPAGAPDGAGAVDPVSAPGSQIAVGKKVVAAKDDPKAVKIDISKDENKVDMKPFIEVIDNVSNAN